MESESKISAEKRSELAAKMCSGLWSKRPWEVQEALAQGADPNVLDHYGQAPLRVALMEGAFKEAQLLVDAGALLDGVPSKPPLISDALWTLSEPDLVVAWLLGRGADPEALDEDGQAPLHFAAVYSRVESAKLLVAAGADVNRKNKASGLTPLMLAASCGHLAFCEALLSLGGRAEELDDNGRDALYWARGRDKDEEGVVALLLMRKERRELDAAARAAAPKTAGRSL